MNYDFIAIAEGALPQASSLLLQHLVDTYASESNKVVSVWRSFGSGDLDFRPYPRSSTVREVMKHQLLSERRFFAEFLGSTEPVAPAVLPESNTVEAFIERFVELARPRLGFIARQTEADWLRRVPFFDVERERIWIFWRRVLHTAHHRTQLTVYLRALARSVPSSYGPTADVTWTGADPTTTVEAAGRK